MPYRKHRVFDSFDFDKDLRIRQFIVNQARRPKSPFDVEDWSLKEFRPQRNWEEKAMERIARSDSVLVMLGRFTHRAPGVRKEVAMARELGVPVFQIIGYKDSNPIAVPNGGRVYKWKWGNLEYLLQPVYVANRRARNRASGSPYPFRQSRRF